MSESVIEAEERNSSRCLGVTVRTPAGASSAFAITHNDDAGELTERAVDYFVSRELLEPGRLRLGLVRDGHVVDLAPDDRLVREGVVEGDVLHLLTCEDQVDGSVRCFIPFC